ncbi:MAG: hypothetical protein M0T70_04385 [Geobacteraceae bacterium]|nr:hypothetical protein [Geobacteraceae bacterium]
MPFPVNTVDGLFHNGDPSTNTPGTVIDADWLNAVQMAIIAMGTVVKTVVATYPISNNDGVIFGDTSTAAFTITLPVSSGLSAGKRFSIKCIGDNLLSVVAADGKYIDDGLQVDMVRGDKMTVCYDGTNWQAIS